MRPEARAHVAEWPEGETPPRPLGRLRPVAEAGNSSAPELAARQPSRCVTLRSVVPARHPRSPRRVDPEQSAPLPDFAGHPVPWPHSEERHFGDSNSLFADTIYGAADTLNQRRPGTKL